MNVRDRLGSLLAPSLLAGTGRPMPDVLIVGGSLAGAGGFGHRKVSFSLFASTTPLFDRYSHQPSQAPCRVATNVM